MYMFLLIQNGRYVYSSMGVWVLESYLILYIVLEGIHKCYEIYIKVRTNHANTSNVSNAVNEKNRVNVDSSHTEHHGCIYIAVEVCLIPFVRNHCINVVLHWFIYSVLISTSLLISYLHKIGVSIEWKTLHYIHDDIIENIKHHTPFH